MPITALPGQLPFLEASGARRVVAVSTTSRFSRIQSCDPRERQFAQSVIKAEEEFETWASHRGIEWAIIRPTLIYGRGEDRNISEVARFIQRFGCFPILADAGGLRQPIHVDDVCTACLAALRADPSAINRSYNIAGAETLTYREMIERVYEVMDRKPRLIRVPLAAFHLAVRLVRLLPRYRGWSGGMAERMTRDLTFESSDVETALNCHPRRFSLAREDLPS